MTVIGILLEMGRPDHRQRSGRSALKTQYYFASDFES